MNFQKGYSEEPVLLKNYNNGIVNNIGQESVESRLQMFEKVATKNKSTTYASYATKGILEDNVYSQVFFSKENIQIININQTSQICLIL